MSAAVYRQASPPARAGRRASTLPGTSAQPRVALYARYSSDRQSENSIEDQLRICRERVEREGWQLVRSYQDAAISGSTADRPGFIALQAAMRAGEIDIVFSEALDRISRDQEHVARFFKLANFTNVRLVTISEGEVSTLHIGLKGTMNAMYLQDLAAKTRRGLEGRVRAGRSTGPAPYGYRRVTSVLRPDGEIDRGLWEIVPEHAAIVRRIFEEYAQGHTAGVIVRRLNADGVPGPRANGWNTMTVRGRPSHGDGILRNRAYLGEMVWNRRRRLVDPTTGQLHRRLNAVDERVTGLAPQYRLIDRALWDAVQARLSSEAAPQDPTTGELKFWERRKQRYLLSGKISCGVCGGPFSIQTGKYACNNRPRRLCTNPARLDRTALEDHVLALLSEHMMDPELARAFAEEFSAEWDRLAGQRRHDEARNRRELEAAEKKLGNLIDAIAAGMRSSALQAKLDEAEGEVARLKAASMQGGAAPVRMRPDIGVIYRLTMREIRIALEGPDSAAALELARSLIERAIVYPGNSNAPPTVQVEGILGAMLKIGQPELCGSVLTGAPRVLTVAGAAVTETASHGNR
ncbi:recombinase family protein [Rhodovarius crocodyli]|uniref:Recombinase family protein n=1 Tax=Rhodovarius crocodyli TaxID=1979269 RepID=A0A437LV58_9PROT|nr:recombinase family protein [Rhodovarius crocodyli]RVT89279.1 recombinase family protein [Rhodovarius crocodyli]